MSVGLVLNAGLIPNRPCSRIMPNTKPTEHLAGKFVPTDFPQPGPLGGEVWKAWRLEQEEGAPLGC